MSQEIVSNLESGVDVVDMVDRANRVLLETVVTAARVVSDSEKIKYIERYVALELFEFLRTLLKKLNAKEMYCEGLSLYPHVVVVGDNVLSLQRNWIDLIEINLSSADILEKWECREKS